MHCSVATPADDAAIRRLLRENAMDGTIRITFEREPDYFLGTGLAGGTDQTILVTRDSKLGCVGRCTRRTCWVNGQKVSAGYLGELRLDRAFEGRAGFLRRGYEFFHSLQSNDPADIYYTAIASDNLRARRALESGIRALPRYEFLGELTTLLIGVPRHPVGTSMRVERAISDSVPDLIRILNGNARSHQFAAVWTEDILRGLARYGLPLDRFLIAFRGTEAVACGALWDQRAFRQTVIKAYSRTLALVRPALNLGAQILGRPRLPSPGSILSHAFISPLACDLSDEESLYALIESFSSIAKEAGLDFLTLAFASNDQRLPRLKARYYTRAWSSRLYRVNWPGQSTITLDPRLPLLPDIALL